MKLIKIKSQQYLQSASDIVITVCILTSDLTSFENWILYLDLGYEAYVTCAYSMSMSVFQYISDQYI